MEKSTVAEEVTKSEDNNHQYSLEAENGSVGKQKPKLISSKREKKPGSSASKNERATLKKTGKQNQKSTRLKNKLTAVREKFSSIESAIKELENNYQESEINLVGLIRNDRGKKKKEEIKNQLKSLFGRIKKEKRKKKKLDEKIIRLIKKAKKLTGEKK